MHKETTYSPISNSLTIVSSSDVPPKYVTGEAGLVGELLFMGEWMCSKFVEALFGI
jgi:hypothetical protein